MIYKKLIASEANQLINECERLDIEYDIWNAEETMTNSNVRWEIGLSEKNWDKILTTKED